MARVDTVSWLKSQVAALRKAHNDVATGLRNLITGQTVSLSPGVWAPSAQGIQTPPSGAATWFTISGASSWSAVSGAAKPAVLLLPANLVLFVGTMSGGTTTNGTQILNALPSWAWPAHTGCRIALNTTGGTNGGYLTISLSGIVACQALATVTATIGWCAIYPTDCIAAP